MDAGTVVTIVILGAATFALVWFSVSVWKASAKRKADIYCELCGAAIGTCDNRRSVTDSVTSSDAELRGDIRNINDQ